MLRRPPDPDPLPRILLTLLTGAACLCAPAAAWGESGAATGGGRTSASLMFKIVIPSVLIMDSRTGTMYTNDRKDIAQLGVLDARGLRDVPRTAWTVVNAPATGNAGAIALRGAASHAAAHGRRPEPSLRDRGAVLCSP